MQGGIVFGWNRLVCGRLTDNYGMGKTIGTQMVLKLENFSMLGTSESLGASRSK